MNIVEASIQFQTRSLIFFSRYGFQKTTDFLLPDSLRTILKQTSYNVPHKKTIKVVGWIDEIIR